jgi:hypothetical protein
MRSLARIAPPVVLVAAVASASADTVTWTGEVVEGNSWSTGFLALTLTPADFIGIRVTSAEGSLEGPVFFNFSNASWGELGGGDEFPRVAAATGSAFTSLGFNVRFAGDATDLIDFDMVFFNGDAVASVFSFEWDSVSFGINYGGTSYDMSRRDFVIASGGPAIPLPSAAALAGAALVGAGAGRRQRR